MIAETSWRMFGVGSVVRILLLLFVLWMLYRGLKGLTLWHWSGFSSVDGYRDARTRYAATVDVRYLCKTCGVERAGRQFYFDATGPDGHRVEKCMACVMSQAASTTGHCDDDDLLDQQHVAEP